MPRLRLSRPHAPRSGRVPTVLALVVVVALLSVAAAAAFAYSNRDASGSSASVSTAIANATTLGPSASPSPSALAGDSSGPETSPSAVPAGTSEPTSAPATDAPSLTPPPTLRPTATRPPTAAPTPIRTPVPTPAPTPAPTAPPSNSVVSVLAAGDVRSNTNGITATANLIKGIPGLYLLNVGDDSANGTAAEYTSYFEPTWGQFKDRIFPTPGNHEYNTAGAAPYFAYYGSRAGTAGQGWYSFDFTGTAWHVIELNGNVAHGAGSAQETWLRRDLAANAGKHIIAFWHQPRFSSGTEHGSDTSYTAFWNDLYAAHADIVLNGHDHDYERFALQNGAGQADPQGIREFVVGMGGTTERAFGGSFVANSEAHNDSCWGVLKLTLRAHSYDWQFLPVSGGSYHDSGSQATHS